MKIQNIGLIIVAAIMLAACAKSADITQKQDYDFSNIQTYSLFPRESNFVDIQALTDVQRNGIELTIEKAMEEAGYEYKDWSESDMIISYFWVRRSLASLHKYNKAVGACLACTTNEQNELNKDIRTNNLIIDVLESERKRTVYRGVFPVDIEADHTSDENLQEIITAVDNILLSFPKRQN